MPAEPRPHCLRCRRAEAVCVCAELHVVESRTRVVFLQHPREARMPVSTCRLAHLSLPGSSMYVGRSAEVVPAMRSVAAEPGAVLLFPGPGVPDVTELAEPPRTLVVVDGTWTNARKLIERSPLLAALPRVGFTPSRPGNYRIRREPAPHCVSTIEAVVHVLEVLEEAPGRYTPMLAAFERMVDVQLACIAASAGRGARHKRTLRPPVREQLAALGSRAVTVFAEGNVSSDGVDEVPQLLRWVAQRAGTGERFESLVRPRRPMAAQVEENLDLAPGALAGGEELAVARERWRAFLGPDDVLVSWGSYAFDLLGQEVVAVGARLDMKPLLHNGVGGRLGGVEALADRLGVPLPAGEGRARRKVAALDAVIRAVVSGELVVRRATEAPCSSS